MTARRLKAVPACAGLAFRRLFSGRRYVAGLLLLAFPVGLMLVSALVAKYGVDRPFYNERFFQTLMHHYVFALMMLLLGLVYGLAISREDIDDGTAGYLFLTALPRWWIALNNILVTGATLGLLIFVSILLTRLSWSLGRAPDPNLVFQNDFVVSFRYGVLAFFGILAHLSFFSFCGYTFRHAVGIAIGAAIGWEFIVTLLPMKLAAYTVTNNVWSLILYAVLDGSRGQLYRHVRNYTLPDYATAAWTLTILIGFWLAAAMVAVMNRNISGREQ